MARHLNSLEKDLLIRKFGKCNSVKFGDFCSTDGAADSTFRRWQKLYEKRGAERLVRISSDIDFKYSDCDSGDYKREILRLRIENEYLKSMIAREYGTIDEAVSSRDEDFRIVNILSVDFPVRDICTLMGVSRSGYYKWLGREPSEREINRLAMMDVIERVHAEHPTHGYRWVSAYIRLNMGIKVSDSFVYKCFRMLGIKSRTKHKVKITTSKTKENFPNLVFSAWKMVDKPRSVIVSDMTPLDILASRVELTMYFDVFTKEILAWRVGERRGKRKHYIEGLRDILMLLDGKTEPTVLHTDRGNVYSSVAYNKLIRDKLIVRSMSRAGKPTDNPVSEALNGWIKEELYTDFRIDRCRSRKDLNEILERYVHFYNEERPCYAIGYDTPSNYKKRYYKGELER